MVPVKATVTPTPRPYPGGLNCVGTGGGILTDEVEDKCIVSGELLSGDSAGVDRSSCTGGVNVFR